MPKVVRQYVLGQNPLNYHGSEHYTSPDTHILRSTCAELIAFRNHDWKDVLNQQDDLYQEKLFEVTTRLYEDIPNAGQNEDDFMAGYLYAANLIFTALTPDEPSV